MCSPISTSSQKQEQDKSHLKPVSKTSIALAVAAALLPAGSAIAAYVDPGMIGNKASWETAEYQKDWGLAAMKASSAYALGFRGQGVKVGVMDSGALLYKHPELNGDRFHAVRATGEYGTSGKRYPDGSGNPAWSWGKYGDYSAGQKFDVTGEWIKDVNDSHGTHVTGSVGANRDGSEFHGVAWGSDVYVGNTGATDNNNYGPFQDYKYFYAGWKALVNSGVQVINNSWGTNTRIIDNGTKGPDGGSIGIHLPAATTADTEYEYFYHKKVYGDGPSFINAAWDAVKGTGVVQVFTTGNRDFANPFYRPLFPYFNPEVEQNWIAVGGLQKNADGTYQLVKTWNEAGNGKWWTVVAPGSNIWGSKTDVDGNPIYANSSGTSMAAPHVTGAMGVLLSRYQDMTGTQARDVMFTTANHLNPDGSVMASWTAADGVPDVRYGWGVPDLDKGMYGPGQLLGRFDYNMARTALDVWTNNISQTALDARKLEDLAWLQEYKAKGIAAGGSYVLGDGFVVNDGNTNTTDHIINQADAQKWRAEYYAKRAAAIQAKLDAGLYNGTLVKQGAGELVMTGSNTYRGGTSVEAGALYGFTESFGTEKVAVNGGKFGVIARYKDNFTQKGILTSTEARKASIDVNSCGTYVVSAGETVNVGSLTFKTGSKITVGSRDINLLDVIYRTNSVATGVVNSTQLTDANKAVVSPDYAFFKTTVESAGNTLTAKLSRDSSASFASYASNENSRAIADVIAAAPAGALYGALLTGSKDEIRNTYNALGSDFYLNAQNASIINTLNLSRAVKDQALGVGGGRSVERDDGKARLWVSGLYGVSNLDYGQSAMDVDFSAALLGAEVDITTNAKLGLYLGGGSSDFKGDQYGKLKSNDIHLGAYGLSKLDGMASISYGANYTRQSRDATRALVAGSSLGVNSVKANADIGQIFAEAAYTKLNTETYSLEPYVGLGWMHLSSDGYSESVGSMTFATDVESQNLQIATLGVRGAMPLSAGNAKMTVKGDLYGMRFFGDTAAAANLRVADSGVAQIKGGDLKSMFGLTLGLETQLSKSTTIGLSYAGTLDSDTNSNGLFAKLNVSF